MIGNELKLMHLARKLLIFNLDIRFVVLLDVLNAREKIALSILVHSWKTVLFLRPFLFAVFDRSCQIILTSMIVFSQFVMCTQLQNRFFYSEYVL